MRIPDKKSHTATRPNKQLAAPKVSDTGFCRRSPREHCWWRSNDFFHQHAGLRSRGIASIGLLLGLAISNLSMAQLTPPKSSKDNLELTDGLLELLNEPQKPATPKDGAELTQPQLTPADVGLDGEDLGENTANPLESVRQSMFIAAGLLQRGATDSPTQELQSNIVQRLDELIARVEREQTPRNRSSSKQSRSERQASENPQPSPRGSEEQRTRQQTSSDSDSTESRPNGQNPGQAGINTGTEVDLADPIALQQNVWGHLPERMRTQMQSRMVEQFLPSYREQIEAYFKALLEQR